MLPCFYVHRHFSISKGAVFQSRLWYILWLIWIGSPTQYIYPIYLNHLLVRADLDILRFGLVGVFRQQWNIIQARSKYIPRYQRGVVFSSSEWHGWYILPSLLISIGSCFFSLWSAPLSAQNHSPGRSQWLFQHCCPCWQPNKTRQTRKGKATQEKTRQVTKRKIHFQNSKTECTPVVTLQVDHSD